MTPMSVRLAWTGRLELGGLLILPLPAEPLSAAPLRPDVREESVTTRPSKPPVAVLVHGSGPNDRDETIGPNKPFRDLAIGFAAQGIATLRYEKRTRALASRPVAEVPNLTLNDEIVDDAVAALKLVSKRRDLGPVFVVGHSEGALLAPRIAAAATQAMIDDINLRRDNVRRLVAHRGLATRDATKVAAADGLSLPQDLPASLWLDLGRYDPAATLLAQRGLPALLTFGGRDFQVPIAEKALWEQRLKGRADTTLVAFPTLNPLLIEGDGPMRPSEYAIPGRVSQAPLDQVGAWIRDRGVRHR